MRRWILALGAACLLGCGARKRASPPPTQILTPPPPPPPGSVIVYGPLTHDGYTPVADEIGWDRDFVTASRVMHRDLVLAQVRATCPADAPPPSTDDPLGCKGTREVFPAGCETATLNARIEIGDVYTLDFEARCAGDATPYAVPAGADPRATLAAAAAKCFRERNKFKTESSWQSIYALTELRIRERLTAVRAPFPVLYEHLAAKDAIPFCRDDGAYLDGAPAGRAASPTDAEGLLSHFVPPPNVPLAVPLTGDGWATEEDRWNACNKASPADVAVQARCQLLRQLDRFLRDVEDGARGETPKGTATSSPSPSISGSAS